jgi:hypothetical protein
MAVTDWFKKKGKEITAENLEAKASEVAAEIAVKEATITEMRAALPGQVLDGDHLAAHRIEHEEREIRALKIAQAELEAKVVEVRESEAIAGMEAQCNVAEEKEQKCEEAARAVAKAIEALVPAAIVLFDAHQDFVAAVGDPHTGNWGVRDPIADDFCDLISLEFYLRSKGAIKATPHVSKPAYGGNGNGENGDSHPRASINGFTLRLRGCMEAMRYSVQRRRDQQQPTGDARHVA